VKPVEPARAQHQLRAQCRAVASPSPLLAPMMTTTLPPVFSFIKSPYR
jgi:hypothetical protein